MTSVPVRAATLGAILLVLASTVAACGGSDASASDDPTQTSSTSPTPSPTPTPSATPLSPFEDKAPVKAARVFMDKVGRAINAGDASMRSLSGVATAAGVTNTAAAVASDLDHRATMPGPQPFTPVAVRVHGGEASVVTCMKTHGWSLDPKTHKTWEKPTVEPVILTFKRVDGRWKFDRTSAGTADCSGVDVKEVRW